MSQLKRAKWMLALVVFGLLVSAVTIWPMKWELESIITFVWGDSEPVGTIHSFLLQALEAIKTTESENSFLFYGYDWLAFAHIVLAILFAGAIRDPVRNIWVIQCGLIMCLLIPVLAGICIPLRGVPLCWFWVDSAFAPAAALPLWIALRDVRSVEKTSAKTGT